VKHEHQDLWNKMLLQAWKANASIDILVYQFVTEACLSGENKYDSIVDIRRTPDLRENKMQVRQFVSIHAHEKLNNGLWAGWNIEDVIPIFLEYKWYNNAGKKEQSKRWSKRKTGTKDCKVKARKLNTKHDWNVVS